jgi:hypothetical protein
VADEKVSETDWEPLAYQLESLINEPEFKLPTKESLLERKLKLVGPVDVERLPNEMEVSPTE